MSRPTSRRGFTLLELVVSAVLVATLLVSIWGLYRMFSDLYETGFVQTEQAQLSRSLLQQLSDDLASTVPPLLEAPSPGLERTVEDSFPGNPGGGRLVSCAARVGLVGTYRALRLDVLQTDPGQSTGNEHEESLLAPPAEAEVETSGEIVTVVYSFEPPAATEIEAASAQPGLTRREVRFHQVDAVAWEALTSLDDAASLGSPPGSRSSPFRRGATADATDDPSREPSAKSFAATIYFPEVVALEFRYFDGQDWIDAWDSRSRRSLPTAVEVSYQLEFVSQRPGKSAAERAAASRPEPGSETRPATDGAATSPPASVPNGQSVGYRFVVYVPQSAVQRVASGVTGPAAERPSAPRPVEEPVRIAVPPPRSAPVRSAPRPPVSSSPRPGRLRPL